MKYITGIHALNLPCKLETYGDWHQSALKWKNISIKESDSTILGNYGIEKEHLIPEHSELYNSANHIRALLDLIIDGNFAVAQGMRNDFICNEKYTIIIFDVLKSIWNKLSIKQKQDINSFMLKEYKLDWFKYSCEFIG